MSVKMIVEVAAKRKMFRVLCLVAYSLWKHKRDVYVCLYVYECVGDYMRRNYVICNSNGFTKNLA